MDDDAPPIQCNINDHQNRYLSNKKKYKLFDLKNNRFYNSSTHKNKMYFKSNKKTKKHSESKEKKDNHKTRIAINIEKLKELENNNLIELIQFIEFTCDLTLNDYRYANKSYSIFKIIKNKEKKGYDIIIDKNLDNNNNYNKTDLNAQDDIYNQVEEEDDNNIDNNKEKENSFESQKKNIINFKTIDIINNKKENDINNDNEEKSIGVICQNVSKERNTNKNNKKQFTSTDFNQTFSDFYKRPKVSNDIYSNNKNSIYNNPPPIPNMINDSPYEEEDEDKKEDNEKEKNSKTKEKYIKCTDCDLIYDTVEEMSLHYYNIHAQNIAKEKKTSKEERKKSKMKEINKKFEQWAGNRMGYKNNKYKKNIKNKMNNNIKVKINNNNDLSQMEEEENEHSIDEEEEVKKKYLSDVNKVLENKKLKFREKMKEISIKESITINKFKNYRFKGEISEDNKNFEFINLIKGIREEEKKKINKETKEILKKIKLEKNNKLNEIKLKKTQKEEQKKKEEETRRLEELKRKEEEKRLEELKRKQEEKRLEELRRKEEERKRLELEKIKLEEIRKKMIEEEISRQNELKRQEEIRQLREKQRLIEKLKSLEDQKNKKELQFKHNLINNIYDKENKPNEIFICEEDGINFFSEKSYLEHYDEEHPDSYPFFCDKCDKGFNSLNAYSAHKNDSFKHKNGNVIHNFYCNVCNRKFGSKFALNAHLKDKGHFKNFQCHICGKIFMSKMAIDNHCKDKKHFVE